MEKFELSLGSENEEICTHPGFVDELCIKCRLHVQDDSAIPLKYIHKNLRIAKDEMTRLRDKGFEDLVCLKKKLYLVLDLDHTLLDSVMLTSIEEEEEQFIDQRDSLLDTWKSNLFIPDKMERMTKLRPFVHVFLEEASKLFEMYIYTTATRGYALEMAELIDPENKYFCSRIISRDDSTQENRKSLDIVLGRESAVLIVDDTKRVWENNLENLIWIDEYEFFTSDYGESLFQRKTDEKERVLANVLKVLQQVHTLFFDKERKDNIKERDVRQGYVNNASNPHTVGEACDHKSGGANGESVDAPAKDVTRVRTRE
ncbi:RNA polymerase II C-terminal domain phosphatase-like 4 [Salvia hispanica]|uniref:RNA polymerase II C-terminal domain phosphatase-like 4 n=1 Tax=Salvia hispanica TaxID=49212 RepID=UPI0020090752|nr:RNA polymerase II C-terminal domain phosphatase-like 4 [Salvia hispanica]